MMQKFISWRRVQENIITYLLSFFELQFVITLMSLPVLIIWGMPISIMAPLANLVFTPLLIIFLWCSCFATIGALLSVKYNLFTIVLDYIAQLWMHILSYSNPCWLIGFPISMFKVSIFVCIVIVAMYMYLRPPTKIMVFILTTFWLSLIILRPWYKPSGNIQQVGDLKLWACTIGSTTYLIDHGGLTASKNLYNNLDFTILPELIRTTGLCTIDTLILCKPSTRIEKIAQQCCKQFGCTNIMVTPKSHCYQKIRAAFAQTNINVTTLQPLRNCIKPKLPLE